MDIWIVHRWIVHSCYGLAKKKKLFIIIIIIMYLIIIDKPFVYFQLVYQ